MWLDIVQGRAGGGGGRERREGEKEGRGRGGRGVVAFSIGLDLLIAYGCC